MNYCNTLIVRMRGMLASSELRCLFGSEGEDICTLLDGFLKDPQQRICLISFKNVSFNHNARELLLNTIGEYLLGLARADRFRAQPVICFLDEAHQFMGRSVGDEFNSVSLDAFGLIAKEGRKYGLTTVLATQRPRDVPQDVLSQLGTLFVHRLTNERDRETIERACGDLDRSAAAFIPSLSQGEAIVLGPDLPAPLPIQITAPDKTAQPTSRGPDYQRAWRQL
ncbi:ATP-binding protein [Gemmobacter lanyuensis]|uniref:ATP-binding protein n=1 Tax=Gemmobacter lanyuensis TaxID=1054497 RepID=UPI0036166FC6